jgi:Lrp/AsnC family transcriptional regulator, regulator for asnA, asnC and gidA
MAHTPGTTPAAGALDGQPALDKGRRRAGTASTGGAQAGTVTLAPAVVLDGISMQIVEQLQQDGRRSYAAIGKAVGLSEAAVRQRVQRLLEAGVMQIVAVTDPLTLGFRRQCMIGIKCEGDPASVANHLAGMEEIDYVVIIAGSFDLLIEVVCEDDDHLLEILSRVRTVPSVTSTETFVYLKLRKQTYSWGTR